jgi:hypothetical protein
MLPPAIVTKPALPSIPGDNFVGDFDRDFGKLPESLTVFHFGSWPLAVMCLI